MTISIHQPNFCPWKPFFEKIEQADVFIILSHCQYEKGGYQSRFKVGDKWHGLSVNRGLEPIVDKQYVNLKADWKSLTNKFPKLKVFDDCIISDNLSQTNTAIIRKACKILGIKTQIVCDGPTELNGTERLVSLCARNGAKKYLSGISGLKYLDIAQFEKAGIEVVFQKIEDKRPLIDLL